MSTIRPGDNIWEAIEPGNRVDIVANGKALVQLFGQKNGDPPLHNEGLVAGDVRTYGPYLRTIRIRVTAFDGSVDYEESEGYADAPLATPIVATTTGDGTTIVVGQGAHAVNASVGQNADGIAGKYLAARYVRGQLDGFTLICDQNGGDITVAMSAALDYIRENFAIPNKGRVPTLDWTSGNYVTSGTVTWEPWMRIVKKGNIEVKHLNLAGPAFWLRADKTPSFDQGEDADYNSESVCGGPGVLKVIGNPNYVPPVTVAAKEGGNTGNGTVNAITRNSPYPGVWTLTCTAAATNSGTFSVVDPGGNSRGNATVGTPFQAALSATNGFVDLAFTITDGSVDYVVGDSFTLSVAEDASGIRVGNGDGYWGAAYTGGNLELTTSLAAIDGFYCIGFDAGLEFTMNSAFCQRFMRGRLTYNRYNISLSGRLSNTYAGEQSTFNEVFMNNARKANILARGGSATSSNESGHQMAFLHSSITYSSGDNILLATPSKVRIELDQLRAENGDAVVRSTVLSPKSWIRASNLTRAPSQASQSKPPYLRKDFISANPSGGDDYTADITNYVVDDSGGGQYNTDAVIRAAVNFYLADPNIRGGAVNMYRNEPPGTVATSQGMRTQPIWSANSALNFNAGFEAGAIPGAAIVTAKAGNTGNGTMGTVTISQGAKPGLYRLTVIEKVTDQGAFVLEDPDGVTMQSGVVGTAYSQGGVAFTLSDGATDYVAGDQFTISVPYTGFTVSGTGTWSNVNNDGAYGTSCAQLACSAQQGRIVTEKVPCEPGHEYTGGFCYKLTGVSGQIYFQPTLTWYAADGVTVLKTDPFVQHSNSCNMGNRTNEWAIHITGAGRKTAPAGARFVDFSIDVSAGATSLANCTATVKLDVMTIARLS